ncbi:MAG: hypothetical protein EBX37_06515 [Alphaproteobacteria bacterium]|nr:hypothetical protein [Alphaproteobacteria bacterium]
MGGKRNKIRYTAEVKHRKKLVLTGTVFLRYEDDEEDIQQAKPGDLLVYPQNEALNTTRQGDYRASGFSGYFKVDVAEGKVWCPLLLTGIFDGKENHFSKTEHPMDTFQLCGEMLVALAGRTVSRTYREHYELMDEDAQEEEAPPPRPSRRSAKHRK